MSAPAKPPRKKKPKQLAVLDEDTCTGCEACMTVCPVDCIDKMDDPNHPLYAMGICSIDMARCIGCKLCAQVCPWDCITMVKTEDVEAIPELAPMTG